MHARILELLIPVFLGLGLRLTGVFGDREGVVLRRFVLSICIPLMAFFALYDAPVEDMSRLPLILAGVGMTLDVTGVHRAWRPALAVSAVTLLVAPVAGWCVATLLCVDPISRNVVTLIAAMPVALSTPLLAQGFDMDLDITHTSIVLSTLLCGVTLPALAYLLGG